MAALVESEQVMAFMGSGGGRIKMRRRSDCGHMLGTGERSSDGYGRASNTSSDGPTRARSNSVQDMQIHNLIA